MNTGQRTRPQYDRCLTDHRTPDAWGRDQCCPKRSRKKVSETHGTVSQKMYKMFAQVEGKRSTLTSNVGTASSLPRRQISKA